MSDQEKENLLDAYFQKLTSTHLGVTEYSKEELVKLFRQIIEVISADYLSYRKFIPRLLATLERNDKTSIVILINSYFGYFDELLKIKDLQIIDESILSGDYPDNISKKILNAYAQSVQHSQQIRISDFTFNKSSLSSEDRLATIAFLVDVLQENSKNLEWDNDTVQSIMMYLPVLRDLLKEQGNNYSFFILTGMVMDRFSSSEYFQLSRDLAEELIYTSYLDETSYLGYFNSFRCYSNNSSVIPSLLYGNLSLYTALNSKTLIPEKFVKEIIWQGVKYFRNASLFPWVQKIYDSVPSHIVFTEYEQRSLTHSYFLSLLIMVEPNLPSLILDFLNEHREKIYSGGVNDSLPWLIILYNVQITYPNADFSATGLGHYLGTLEIIVPPDNVSAQKAIIQGDSVKLKPLLKASLVKLNEARNASDVVQDNESALKIAGRIIDHAVETKDAEALILAMIVKADYSFIFIEKGRQETSKISIPNKDNSSFESIYGSESEMLKRLQGINDYSFLWVFSTEQEYYYLLLTDTHFSTMKMTWWEHQTFREIINAGFFSHLIFDDTIKTKREVRSVLPEEHLHESNRLKNQFSFIRITSAIKNPILIVMDISLAGFPHNLFLDSNANFLYTKSPICNILSTEWYLKYANQVRLSHNFSKSIWIPIDGGDFTLNQLYSKLEDTLRTFSFNITKTIYPEKPISSEVNVVVAHGGDDIALKQVVYPDSIPRLNLETYLGPGKILIMFVCHSGSFKTTPFKNSISSIIKQYIAQGYSAVVAPFWSLHINIPQLWLPVFLCSLEQGKEIMWAVQDANLKVLKHYPTIAAWLCMHLYGDPHLQILSQHETDPKPNVSSAGALVEKAPYLA